MTIDQVYTCDRCKDRIEKIPFEKAGYTLIFDRPQLGNKGSDSLSRYDKKSPHGYDICSACLGSLEYWWAHPELPDIRTVYNYPCIKK